MRSRKVAKAVKGRPEKRVARKVTSRTKNPASFKTANWYASAARSFGLSTGEGASPREASSLRNRTREPNHIPGD